MGLHDSGLCPLQNLFRVQFLDSVELQSELFLKAYLSAQKTHLQVVGAGTGDTVECSGLTSMPPPPRLSKAEAGPSLPHIPCPSRQSPLVLAEAGQPTMLLSLPPGWVCGVSR